MSVEITSEVVGAIRGQLHTGAEGVTRSSASAPTSVDAGDAAELVNAAMAVLQGVGHTIGSRLTSSSRSVGATNDDFERTDAAGAQHMSHLHGGL